MAFESLSYNKPTAAFYLLYKYNMDWELIDSLGSDLLVYGTLASVLSSYKSSGTGLPLHPPFLWMYCINLHKKYVKKHKTNVINSAMK